MDRSTVDILRHADSGRQSKAEAALFADVDKDGSGTISKEEFNAMYANIKEAILEEHQALSSSKKRAKMLCTVVAMLSVFMAILLGANGALTYYVVDMSKDTAMSGNKLVNKATQESVSTDKASYKEDIFDIARVTAQAADVEEVAAYVSTLHHMTYFDPRDEQKTFTSKIDSVGTAHGMLLMKLADGVTLGVDPTDNDILVSSTPVGSVTFDTTGTSKLVLASALKDGDEAALPAEALAICQDAGCANEDCHGTIALPVHLKSVSCGATPIWNYFDELTASTNRRALWGGATKKVKKVAKKAAKTIMGDSKGHGHHLRQSCNTGGCGR